MADGEDLSEASEPSTTCNGGLGVLTTMVVVKAEGGDECLLALEILSVSLVA